MSRKYLVLIALLVCLQPRVYSQKIATCAGNGAYGYSSGTMPATMASMLGPTAVATDGAGSLYIVNNSEAWIRKVDNDGIMTIFAGTGSVGPSGDGGPATAATFDLIRDVATDWNGNVYIADGSSRVRKVNAAGIVSAFAGGSSIVLGDGGPATAAMLSQVSGLACDQAGNVYISDNYANRIRKVNTAGIISTFAGNGGSGATGDGGQATAAQIVPGKLATDGAGNVYVIQDGSGCVRKIAPSGIITTFAGSATVSGYSGDGGQATAARFTDIRGIAADAPGNVYISDHYYHVVRKVNPSGVINAFAGNSSSGYSYTGDGGPATAAGFYNPRGLAVRGRSDVYIADYYNYVVRNVILNRAPVFTMGLFQTLSVCQNASVSVNSMLAVIDSDVSQPLRWTVWRVPAHGAVSGAPYAASSTGSAVTPTGMNYTPTTGYSGPDTFDIRIADSGTVAFTRIAVNVVPIPSVAAITGPTTVCAGQSITLANTVTGGWWDASNTRATIDITTGVVTGVTTGPDTMRYTYTNMCGSASTTKVVTVSPVASPGVITGTSAICRGSSASMSASVSGGTWSVTNAHASVSSSGNVTGISRGDDTVMYKVTLGSCISTTTHAVQIDSTAITGAIDGSPVFMCVGTTATLSDTIPGGVWSASNAHASVSPTGVLTALSEGTDTIRYTITNACGPASAQIIIYVFATPTTAGAIAGKTEVCVGHNVSLSASLAGGTWSSYNNTRAYIGASTGVVHGVSAGAVSMKYTISNGCGSVFTTYPMTVIALADCDLTGIAGTNSERTFSVLPNPSSGIFTVTLPATLGADAMLIITDVSGRKIWSQNVHGVSADIAVNLPAGPYFLSVFGASERYNEKIIVLPR